jgi:peptide/nickel transport system ATP-binding protein
MSPLVDIRRLTVDFDTGRETLRALHGVDLTVAPEEAVGIVGESGSGKSVMWLAALGLLPATATVAGKVLHGGEDLVQAPVARLERVRGRRVAMIFQDPSSSLNPVHRIGRQLVEALALHHGLSGRSAIAEARRLLDRVGIADAARRLSDYPHELSGGLNQRVMIAIALAGRPDLLVADEPTTALDATIQAQILDLLAEIRRETGMALVLISHDLGVVAESTDRVCVMYAGRIVEDAPKAVMFREPAHPYTRGLLAALPALDGPRRRLAAIPGSVPEPSRLPPGCSFSPRCPMAATVCAAAVPEWREVAPGHRVSCARAVSALDVAA